MEEPFEVTVTQVEDFSFEVDFGTPDGTKLATDEPAPLGAGRGPNPARMVAAAIANCLAASLLFCMRKMKAEVAGLRAVARGHLVRNERGRIRIGKVEVTLHLDAPDGALELERCRHVFRDYCTVTESITRGFPVDVRVEAAPAAPQPSAREDGKAQDRFPNRRAENP